MSQFIVTCSFVYFHCHLLVICLKAPTVSAGLALQEINRKKKKKTLYFAVHLKRKKNKTQEHKRNSLKFQH